MRRTAFRNTELIYSDRIGSDVAEMGFKTMLAEGARHGTGMEVARLWFMANALGPALEAVAAQFKALGRHRVRFSTEGGTNGLSRRKKSTGWLASDELEGDVVNLFMDYETFGEHQRADTGFSTL